MDCWEPKNARRRKKRLIALEKRMAPRSRGRGGADSTWSEGERPGPFVVRIARAERPTIATVPACLAPADTIHGYESLFGIVARAADTTTCAAGNYPGSK